MDAAKEKEDHARKIGIAARTFIAVKMGLVNNRKRHERLLA